MVKAIAGQLHFANGFLLLSTYSELIRLQSRASRLNGDYTTCVPFISIIHLFPAKLQRLVFSSSQIKRGIIP